MKHLKRFNEMVETDEAKAKLESLFPQVKDLEPIGSGQFGRAYIGTIGNEMVVAKLTSSPPEYWLAQMSMVSNPYPPHVVKFLDVKEAGQSKNPYGFTQNSYAILHEWVNRDGIPSEKTWNLAVEVINGHISKERAYSTLKTREEKYEFELSYNMKKDVESFFNCDIDTLHQNIGYNSDNKLVLFDLDGSITKRKYEEFMNNHK